MTLREIAEQVHTEAAFTLRNRIEDVENGTNPGEMIAAGEAGCFTMSLANLTPSRRRRRAPCR